jgi:hypothetical protein
MEIREKFLCTELFIFCSAFVPPQADTYTAGSNSKAKIQNTKDEPPFFLLFNFEFTLLSNVPNAQVSDTTGDAICTIAGNKKLFLLHRISNCFFNKWLHYFVSCKIRMHAIS